MPYKTRVPRRIKFQPTVLGNLTLRQAAWAGLGIAVGGLIALGVPFPNLPLWVRVLLAAPPTLFFLTIAFGRSRGLTLDAMLVVVARWYLAPRRRVWKRGDFDAFLIERGGDPEAPAMEVDTGAALTFALILANLLILIILVATAWYMWRDGIQDIHLPPLE